MHGILKNVPGTFFFQNDWMNGICLFMKTETFREVGMFDEKFFMNPERKFVQYQKCYLPRNHWLDKGRNFLREYLLVSFF